jgi:octaprenyl-diphosphate synthase
VREAAPGGHAGEPLPPPDEAALVRGAVQAGGLSDFRPVLDALQRTGALDYTRASAEAESRRAIACLDALPSSTWREILLELPAFAVTRAF